ncbi:branched-chain amino acid transport [Zhengella mangrovi]|uniref:Branched-chain amino acid transport n=1 Tax=Zhengella mangrovi TaxID=1982044 RepID=A0A2G1QQT2_9HYPH|nr:AzlD domain-containing protein [Zhengella mangrovi]PHP67578.1 branched-chain amino acid transport [Zhengella mangrovi]
MTSIFWITIAGALATYATRAGGYLILSRFERIPRRVDRALNAVPAAVLTTLVAPSFLKGDWREALTLVLVGAAVTRLPGVAVFAGGWALIVGLRQLGG